MSRRVREPRELIAIIAVVATGCTTARAGAPRSDAPCGGSLGPTAPWCTEPDFPGTLPPATPEAVRAVAGALAAACPPPTPDDPAPGLSASARWAAVHMPRRGSQMPSSMVLTDSAALERVLAGMSAQEPDRARMLDRLAQQYAQLERVQHERCRTLTVPIAPGSYELAQVKDLALEVVHILREAREGGQRTCALLRRDHPGYEPVVPCPR